MDDNTVMDFWMLMPGRRWQRRWRWLAVLCVLAGVAAAAWRCASIDAALLEPHALGYMVSGNGVAAVEPGEDKRVSLAYEKFGGKSVMLAEEFRYWFDSLWQGRRLAGTLLALGLSAGCLCCWIGRRFDPERTDDEAATGR